jgi:hypothetical protein
MNSLVNAAFVAKMRSEQVLAAKFAFETEGRPKAAS